MWKSKNPLGAVPHFHQDRDEFPYAICVQKEIMRFRPVLNFGLPHMAPEDVVVNDYFIPKGAVLISSMAAMHENPDVYDDPEVFKPERFMMNTKRMGAAANAKIEDRDHFGFGWGRRICPGIHLVSIRTQKEKLFFVLISKTLLLRQKWSCSIFTFVSFPSSRLSLKSIHMVIPSMLI